MALFKKTDRFIKGGFARSLSMGNRIMKVVDAFYDDAGMLEFAILVRYGTTNYGNFIRSNSTRFVYVLSEAYQVVRYGRYPGLLWYTPCKALGFKDD